MGSKSKRLQNFLKSNPVCCYCSGSSQATTEDHWPSRSIFHERKWPEGFVFPACQKCNAYSSSEEPIFAFLSRTSLAEHTDSRGEESLKILKAIEERNPEIFREFKKNIPKPNGILYRYNKNQQPPRGTNVEFAISIDHPDIFKALEICSQKLLFSLFYKESGSIVNETGGCFLQILSNGSKAEESILEHYFNFYSYKISESNWQKTNINDQFEYESYLLSPSVIAFRIKLHLSLFVNGIVSKENITPIKRFKIYRPFIH